MAPDVAQCIYTFNDIRVPRRNYIDSAKRALPRHMPLYLMHFLSARRNATFSHSPSHCSIEKGTSMEAEHGSRGRFYQFDLVDFPSNLSICTQTSIGWVWRATINENDSIASKCFIKLVNSNK